MSSPQPQTVEDREKERAEFYGKYVAVRAIQINGVNAFAVGEPVPVDHVEVHKNVPLDAVAKTTTKAGQQATAAATGENPKG